MSTLTSSSTDSEVEAAYDNAASWYEDQSVAKARAFVTACRILIRRCATAMYHGQKRVEFDIPLLRSELEQAAAFVEANGGGTGPRVTRADFSPGRE